MVKKTSLYIAFWSLNLSIVSASLETNIEDTFLARKDCALLTEQAFSDLMKEFSIHEKDQWPYHYFLGKNMAKAANDLYLIQKFSQIPNLETFENHRSHKIKFSFFYEKDFGITVVRESVETAYKNLIKFYLRPKIEKHLNQTMPFKH